MNIGSLTSNAFNMITASQHKAEGAADKIATFAVQNQEVGSENFNSTNLDAPILSLNEAEFQNSAAVKLLDADRKMVGSLLDIRA